MVDFARKPVAAAPKKAASKTKPDPIKIAGVEPYARVDVAAKAYKAACETLGRDLKVEAQDIFIGQGVQFGKRPANFDAVEGKASVNIQLKASSSALSEDAVKLLKAADIPLREADEVVETFRFNAKYAEDDALLAKIKDALDGIEGIPDDLIEFQSQKKIVCDGDATIDAIFRLKAKGGVPARTRVETLLPLVTTLALKATTTETLEEALDGAEEFILVKD